MGWACPPAPHSQPSASRSASAIRSCGSRRADLRHRRPARRRTAAPPLVGRHPRRTQPHPTARHAPAPPYSEIPRPTAHAPAATPTREGRP